MSRRRDIQRKLGDQRDAEEFERMLSELALHEPDPQVVRDRAKADFFEKYILARVATGKIERLNLSAMSSLWGEADIAWRSVEAVRYGVDVNAWRDHEGGDK
jgi:hypothetical protein